MEHMTTEIMRVLAEGNMTIVQALHNTEEEHERRWLRDPHRGIDGLYETSILAWIHHERNDSMKERLGMSVHSFLYFCDLFTYIKLPSNISIQKAISIYLYRIVSGAARYVLEDVFRIPPENISRIIHEVNTYIYTNLRPSWIQLPNDDQMEDSSALFYGHRRMVNVIGAVLSLNSRKFPYHVSS